MRRAVRAAVVFALVAAVPALSQSKQDADLDLIPDDVLAATADEPAAAPAKTLPGGFRYKAFLEEAPQGNLNRNNLVVPLPPGFQPSWQNRLSADLRAEYAFDQTWSVSLANRLNLLSDQGWGIDRPSWLNDFREGFVTWRGTGETFADAGRVNQKNGVALGFNPTDFFRKNAVDIFVSNDPAVLRDNRLGVVMGRAQVVGDKGSLTMIAAPGFGYSPGQWWSDAGSFGLNLQNTNYNSKFQIKATANLTKNLTPEFILHREGAQSAVGANIAYGIGDNWVAYGEYAGGMARNVMAQSYISGQQLGVLPVNMPFVYPTSFAEKFRNQAAIGISYATAPKLTINLEYHLNQQGMTGADLNQWFVTGQRYGAYPGVNGQLWWIRQFARNQLAPLMQQTAFLRVNMDDVFVQNLSVSDVTFYSPVDRSLSTQATVEYHVNPRLTLGFLAGANFGGPKSNYGSQPVAANVIGKFRFYF